MILQAVYQILIGNPGLAALVGDRVYPVVIPEDVPSPVITFQRVTTDREYTKDGPSGVATVMLQVNVWEPDPLKAAQVGAQVVKALHAAWNGAVAGVELGEVKCLNEMDAYDEETKLAGVQLEWSIQYVE